jgi:hypothetical protein
MQLTKTCTILWVMSPYNLQTPALFLWVKSPYNLQRPELFCELCHHATYKDPHCFVSYVAMQPTKTWTVLWTMSPCNLPTGILHEDQYTFLILFRSFLLRMKEFQTNVVEKIKTRILYSVTFFFQKSCYLWDNVEKYSRAGQSTDDNIIRRMRFPCWITKATKTHRGFIVLIAFLLQQWLHERASMLRFMYLVHFVELFHWLCDNTMTDTWQSLRRSLIK